MIEKKDVTVREQHFGCSILIPITGLREHAGNLPGRIVTLTKWPLIPTKWAMYHGTPLT